MLVHGIAGIGKSTLVANWLDTVQENDQQLSVCWYPCQPWDTVTGLAVSLLHRFGIDDQHDPYDLMSTLPLQPGAQLNIDLWRRRLLAYLTDARTIRDRFESTRRGPPPYWLVVIDDAHHLTAQGEAFYGALLSLAEKTPVRLLFISRRTMQFYDQRDVHTRDVIRELPLEGLPWTWWNDGWRTSRATWLPQKTSLSEREGTPSRLSCWSSTVTSSTGTGCGFWTRKSCLRCPTVSGTCWPRWPQPTLPYLGHVWRMPSGGRACLRNTSSIMGCCWT